MPTNAWATWPALMNDTVLIAQFERLRHEMLLLAEVERQGSSTPSWKQLPARAETLQ